MRRPMSKGVDLARGTSEGAEGNERKHSTPKRGITRA